MAVGAAVDTLVPISYLLHYVLTMICPKESGEVIIKGGYSETHMANKGFAVLSHSIYRIFSTFLLLDFVFIVLPKSLTIFILQFSNIFLQK